MGSRYDEMMKSKNFMPFRMGYLTPELVAQAENELNETEETKKFCIPALRKLVQEEAKLVCPTDDEYLLQYLRARKFDIKKAFSLLQSFYQMKKSYSDMYDTYDIELFRNINASGAMYHLPYRDHNLCPVMLLKMAKWDVEQYTLSHIMQALTALILHCIDDPATQVTGLRIIMDIRGSTLRQVRQVTPRYMHLLSRALRNCLPVRFKGIHFYSQSAIFQNIWSLFHIFLSEKIKNRVHFHGDNQKQLQKFIPKEILPVEYGGDHVHFDESDWYLKEIERYYEKYIFLTTCGYKK